jgi:hypothetical protein
MEWREQKNAPRDFFSCGDVNFDKGSKTEALIEHRLAGIAGNAGSRNY